MNWEKMFECARCGIVYKESLLRKNSQGKRVCKRCWDDNEK